jgi:hypothetical protein
LGETQTENIDCAWKFYKGRLISTPILINAGQGSTPRRRIGRKPFSLYVSLEEKKKPSYTHPLTSAGIGKCMPDKQGQEEVG